MFSIKRSVVLAIVFLYRASIGVANPVNLITNGGFELNSGAGTSGFLGWTVATQSGASGSWYAQTGTSSPVNGFPVQAPPEGSYSAMTDDIGPSSQALLQSFTVPLNPGALTLSFQYLYSFGGYSGVFPWAPGYAPPSTLDYNYLNNTGNPNDQAVVNILTSGASALDDSDPMLLTQALQLNPTALGDPNSNPCFPASCFYQSFSMPLTGLAPGATYQLQFAEVDDQGTFNFGVDDVSIDYTASTAPVPEPNSLKLLVPLLGLLAGVGVLQTLPLFKLRESHFSDVDDVMD
jgi:hypothetical protein